MIRVEQDWSLFFMPVEGNLPLLSMYRFRAVRVSWGLDRGRQISDS